MLVLGLETSCDDTAAAVLQDGNKLLSNIINDQSNIHSKYGGIVPELAGRSHIDQVHKVIQCALESAQVKLRNIDLLAVTVGPGLIGSLLVGLNTAKGISYGLGTPLVGVNHLEGHLLAIFLQKQIEFPQWIAHGRPQLRHTDQPRKFQTQKIGRYQHHWFYWRVQEWVTVLGTNHRGPQTTIPRSL